MTYESSIKSPYIKWSENRVVQGDILQSVSFVSGIERQGKLSIDSYNLRYAIVMSQDCDLESHNRALTNGKTVDRALISSVLICPAYPFEQFYAGTHREGIELGTLPANKDKLRVNDQFKRYHYLKADTEYRVTELIVDFKEFFTVSYDILSANKQENYIATINELYRENLAQRFANYLSRIGLPAEDREEGP